MEENTFKIASDNLNNLLLFKRNGYYIYDEFLTVPYNDLVWSMEFVRDTEKMNVFKITDHFLEEIFMIRLNKG